MVLKPWGERKRTVFQIVPEVQAKVNKIPGIRTAHGHAPRRCPAAAIPGGIRHRRHRRAGGDSEVREQLQQKAAANGMFAFPPIIDTKIDQPEVELVMDRDKVAALGLDMADGRLGPGRAGGRQFREPLQPRRPQLQGDPAGQAHRAPERQPAWKAPTSRGRTASWCPSARSRTLKKNTTPRSLNRFQQLNAVKISGVAIRPLDEALKFPRNEAAKILPKATSWITPANRASCASKAASSCRRSRWRWS
jgi:multidrug efflux pump